MAKTITWKELQKKTLLGHYAKYVPEFEGRDDDRKIYCNTYKMIVEALEDLPEEPTLFTRCAMNKAINMELRMMDNIIIRFHYGKINMIMEIVRKKLNDYLSEELAEDIANGIAEGINDNKTLQKELWNDE